MRSHSFSIQVKDIAITTSTVTHVDVLNVEELPTYKPRFKSAGAEANVGSIVQVCLSPEDEQQQQKAEDWATLEKS